MCLRKCILHSLNIYLYRNLLFLMHQNALITPPVKSVVHSDSWCEVSQIKTHWAQKYDTSLLLVYDFMSLHFLWHFSKITNEVQNELCNLVQPTIMIQWKRTRKSDSDKIDDLNWLHNIFDTYFFHQIYKVPRFRYKS